jgi:DNA-binding CsgD family transcriptional regulator
MRPTVPRPSDVLAERRSAILGSAARHANSEGSHDLALAYATMGIEQSGSPALRLEASRAFAGLRRFGDAYAVLPVYPTGLTTSELRRLVRWWGTLVTWMPEGHTLDEISAWLAEAEINDPSILCELDVLRAEAAALAMDWRLAAEIADRVLALESAHTLAGVRCAVIAAFSASQLRGWPDARPLFAEAARLNRDPVTGRPVSVIAELAVLCFEAMGALVWGVAVPGHRERLRRATILAAERDDRGGLAMAGIVSGLVLGLAAHDDRRAELEFGAALQRFDRIEFAVWRPLVAYLRVSALARLGRSDQGRAILAPIDQYLMSHHRLYAYSRFNAEAELDAADGDLRGAQRAVRAAIGLSALGTAGLHDRDLVQLARFADVDDAPVGLARGGLADVGVPDDGQPGPATRPVASPASPVSAVRGHPTPNLAALTDREHEIAMLVARQLSNKEIAQRLFLSVRTVESHVYTARGKLGARSRRELGRLVAGGNGPGAGLPGRER